MKTFTRALTRLVKNERGSTAIEYGLLAAIISVAIILGATQAGTALNSLFTNIGTKLTTEAGSIK
ncbi:MAG: Flp family type IVb pilin [Magnetospirillum sp.]|nr:Flp family type IVb pilin [Magnetospirillum sp.]